MFLQKFSVKYTCTLVRIYTNIHIPIDTYTLIMSMFKPYDSFHSPAINIHIGYIYILTPALVTLEDGLKGRNQTATTKILTHTATYKIKMQTRTTRRTRPSTCVITISCVIKIYIYIYIYIYYYIYIYMRLKHFSLSRLRDISH